MTTFRCRSVKPNESPWFSIEAADVAAAAEAYCDTCNPMAVVFEDEIAAEGAGITTVKFVVVEVDGHGEFVRREFRRGIRRRGGLELSRRPTISDVASRIGWTKKPELLLAPGWIGEEDGYK